MICRESVLIRDSPMIRRPLAKTSEHLVCSQYSFSSLFSHPSVRMSFFREKAYTVARRADWLKDEKVTPMSPKFPNLSEIQSEHELHNYLKDGTELCRVIGLITMWNVPEMITYRTNNVSTLEEKNIRLFINIVEKELKLKNIFGKRKEEVFRKFTDFHVVIDGLSKISKKLQSKLEVKGFEKKEKKKRACL